LESDLDTDGDGVVDSIDVCPNTIVGALVDDAGCGYQLTGAHFRFDSAELNLDADTILNEVALRMQENPGLSLTVGGHTDSVGEEDYNIDLSERRAQAVVDYLVAQGVDSSMLEAVGFGSSMPVASNDTAEGRAANRRVVFNRD
jgi:OOP family OmpA-OmpF porin